MVKPRISQYLLFTPVVSSLNSPLFLVYRVIPIGKSSPWRGIVFLFYTKISLCKIKNVVVFLFYFVVGGADVLLLLLLLFLLF